MNQELKKLFIRFYNLPILPIYRNFFYYIEVLDPYYNTKDKLANFLTFLEENNLDANSFSIKLKDVKQTIIDFLSVVQNETFNNNKQLSIEINNSDLYIVPNAGNEYISVDLVSANFQAIKHIAKITNNPSETMDIIQSLKNYQYLLNHLNIDPFFYESKQLRQFVFGNCNPKLQQKVQKFIITKTIEAVYNHFNLDAQDIITMNTDEIVFTNKYDGFLKDLEDFLNSGEFVRNFDFHIEKFKLKLVHPKYKFFVKDFNGDCSGKIKFKNVPKQNLCEVIKYFEKRPVETRDLEIIVDDRVAIFSERLFDWLC